MSTQPLKLISASLLLSVSVFAIPLSANAGVEVKPAHVQMDERENRIQVALLLDTSNSMDGLISQAKSQLWTLVNELSEGTYYGKTPTIELALYEYGNDNISISKGYVRRGLSLTTDLDAVSEKLFSLTTEGGQEYAGQVMMAAIENLEWSRNPDDMKLLIIAGNEPFTQGPVSYKSACEMAHKKGIVIDTIHCGSEEQGIQGKWKAGADCGHGVYMVINQDEKYVHIPSPYDDQILELNLQLNTTYIGYGERGREYKLRQEIQDSNAASMGKGIQLKRSKSKASKAYKNESWDLVDAFRKDKEAVGSLSADALPEEMKEMSAPEREAYVEKKSAERNAITKQVSELEAKRSEFVTEKRKAMAETKTLDNVMVDAVRRQASEKGYIFDGS